MEKMTYEEILKVVKEKNIKLVRFLYIDADGIIRGYSSTAEELEGDLKSGHLYAQGMAFFSALDTLGPETRYGPVGEWSGVPDPETFRILPYVEDTGVILTEFKTRETHEPSGVCSRSFLREVLENIDFEVKATFENEFYILKRDDHGKIVPFDNSLCFATSGMNASQEIVVEMIEALQKQGMVVEKHYPEYGPSQHEIVIKYDDALKSADNQIFFRETLRGVAQKHGLITSFMPKPFKDLAGSGAHIHISLWKDGKNMFYDSTGEQNLSQLARYFMGGVLKHMAAICAFTAPMVTSYKRLRPSAWSSAYSCCGYNNREAALRIATGQHSRAEKTTNIEFKPVDGTCNPYLALGAILAAGAYGIKNKIEPSDPIEVDPATFSKEELDERGIFRLPETLGDAIKALEQDDLFKEVLGETMFDEYIKLKRFNWNEYNKQVSEWEIEKFVDIY